MLPPCTVLRDADLRYMFPNYTDRSYEGKCELVKDCGEILDILWKIHPNTFVMNFPEDNFFWGLIALSCPKGPPIDDHRFFGKIFDFESYQAQADQDSSVAQNPT